MKRKLIIIKQKSVIFLMLIAIIVILVMFFFKKSEIKIYVQPVNLSKIIKYSQSDIVQMPLAPDEKINNQVRKRRTDPDTGQVLEYEVVLSDIKIKSEIEALEFILFYREYFEIDRYEFIVNKNSNDELSKYLDSNNIIIKYDISQYYHHVPVYGGGFYVYTDYEGNVSLFGSSYKHNINKDNIDIFPTLEAEEAAETSLSGKEKKNINYAFLMIYPFQGRYYLVWRYYICGRDESYIFVDAHNGKRIMKESLMIN